MSHQGAGPFPFFLIFFSRPPDWDTVTLTKKKPSKANQPHGDKAVAVAQRSGGAVETQKKYAAGSNKQSGGPVVNAAKMMDPDEEVKLKTVSHDLKMQISQARQAKGLTQKQLAVKINEKQTVVADYEAGRGIVDPKVLSKMSKALGVKLKK